jgi:uncharacterized protein (TIGR02996 family)
VNPAPPPAVVRDMDEEPFLRAVAANPADPLPRLVYADWLDEHADPVRAEVLRVQVRLAELPADDPAAPGLAARLADLRAGCSPHWLARIDQPVWCVAGNIRDDRPAGPGGTEWRRGTRLFRPNAKVYLIDLHHGPGACLAPDPPEWARLRVLGQQRQSREWLVCWIQARYAMSWRVQLVHQPAVMVRLRKEWWPGFDLRPDEFTPPEDRATPEAVRALLDAAYAARRRTAAGPPELHWWERQ